MEALMDWIVSTPANHLMIDYRWSWPIAETVHFIGLILMAGTVGAFDLRLLGFAPGIPPATLHRMLRYGIAGFGLSAATGLLFISGAPDQYFYNYAFYFKMASLAALGGNAALFYTREYRFVRAMGPDDEARPAAKRMALASLALLAAVMLGGRMLTFFRPPY